MTFSRFVLDNAAAREIDRLSQQDTPSLELMERAARAATEHLVSFISNMPSAPTVAVFAGPGNNGGDALAITRLLHERNIELRSFLMEGKRSPETSEQLERLQKLGLQPEMVSGSATSQDFSRMLESISVLVDGLFGIGLRSALTDERGVFLRHLNLAIEARRKNSGMHIFALDLPSGLFDHWAPNHSIIRADSTLCFGNAKKCLYLPNARRYCGDISVFDIGFANSAYEQLFQAEPAAAAIRLTEPSLLEKVITNPAPDSHKYRRGMVDIYAGSGAYPGAAVLCANAASLSMAGMIRLRIDDNLAAFPPGLRSGIVRLSNSGAPDTKSPDAIVCGPGWGRGRERVDLLGKILAYAESNAVGAVVLDADALYVLPQLQRNYPDIGMVLTPHHAELAALAGVSVTELLNDIDGHARSVAEQFGAVVIAKGAPLRIVSPDGSILLVDAANPALAVAGSGDVLSGILGSQLALAFAANRYDAWRTGAAGDRGEISELQGAAGILLDAVVASVLIHVETGRNGTIAWPDAAALIDEIPRVIGTYRRPSTLTTTFH